LDGLSSVRPILNTAYGIEVLNANEHLQATDDAALVVINQAARDRQELQLTKA
jgi:hypothetical protein